MNNDLQASLIAIGIIGIIIAGTFYVFNDYLRPPYGAEITLSDKYVQATEITDEYQIDNDKLTIQGEITAEIENASMRFSKKESYFKLTPEDVNKKEINFDKNKIKYKTDDIEYHFYSIPVSEEYPTGGYKSDIVLNEKPKTNTFRFIIDSQNVNYTYKEQDCYVSATSSHCSDNELDGSYSISSSIESDMSYKPNGLFTILKPEIIDSLGNKIFGSLNITDNILTITVDEKFFDTSNYPIIIDPIVDYFNTGDDGDSSVSTGSTWNAQTFTASKTYTITSVKIVMRKIGTPGNGDMCIYDISGGDPGSALTCEEFNGNDLPTTEDWIEVSFSSPVELTNSTQYAIVLKADANYIQWFGDNTSPTYAGGNQKNTANSGTDWSDYPGADLAFETYESAASDTCSCPTGDWYVNSSDNCYINTDCDLDDYGLYLLNTGEGALNIIENAIISAAKIESTSTPINASAGTKINIK